MLEGSLEKVLVEVRRLLEELGRHIRVEGAYLFGSYVKGTWVKTSDVDLVVVSRDFEGMKFMDRLDLVYRVEWRLGLKHFVEVIPLTPRELEERVGSSIVLRDASRYWLKVK